MITEDYVSFEIAKLLNTKGFKGEFHKHYWGYESGKEFLTEGPFNSEYDYPAPTLSIVMKWLRKEKDVQIEITIVGTDTWETPTKWTYGFRCQTKDVIDRRQADFSLYEEAAEAAIKYCLENLI